MSKPGAIDHEKTLIVDAARPVKPRAEKAHGDACDCTRCQGFTAGNTVAVRHGAYATLTLGSRATELADWIRKTAPLYADSDEAAVQLCGMALARAEAAEAALDKANPVDRLSLSADARRWYSQALRVLVELGCTPLARGRLGLDVARTVNVLGGERSEAETEAAVAEVRAMLAKVVGRPGAAVVPVPVESVAGAEVRRDAAGVESAAKTLREKLERLLPPGLPVATTTTEEAPDGAE